MPTLTIDVTAPQAARMVAAIGAEMNLLDATGLPRSATQAEAKLFVVKVLRDIVMAHERRIAEKAISIPGFDPT